MGWYGPQTGHCSCCPVPCKIFSDNFNRADNDNVGADWIEQLAGSGWEISGNILTTDVADDLITANDGHPDDEYDLRVWANVHGAIGDQLRVIVCYVDDDNYLFGQAEIATSVVYLSLWKRDSGVNTQLGTTLPVLVEGPEGWQTLLVCHQAEYYPNTAWISAHLTTSTGTIGYLVEDVEGPESAYAGLGTGSLAGSPEAEFDNFNAWILQSPTWPDCPDCSPFTCGGCTDSPPVLVKVVIAGVTVCSLNGTWLLSLYQPGLNSSQCQWKVDTPGGAFFLTFKSTGKWTCLWRSNTFPSLINATWEKPGTLGACDGFDESLPPLGSLTCNNLSSTCQVTAI